MRSRFSAFALGLGDYLVDTLAAEELDRTPDRRALARELSRARETQRFLGLTIVHASERGDEGEVLFVARIFERGADRSFGELSTFAREGGRWKYASGILAPRSALPADLDALTRDAFLAIAAATPSPDAEPRGNVPGR
jgi:SEC-C motif-containing protein